ncbi:MAG: hypothetical protein FJ030_12495, partial [Chloroflexi bacterium]|nr:hypothetical protein [Chloroflexota bacterium]
MTILARWFGAPFASDSIPARLRHDPLAIFSFLVVLTLILAAAFAPLLTSRAAEGL